MSAKPDPYAELSAVLRAEQPVRWISVEIDGATCETAARRGGASGHLELTADGAVRRIVMLYADGSTLRYGPGEIEDEFGGLPDQALCLADLPDSVRDIDEGRFEALYDRAGRNRRT